MIETTATNLHEYLQASNGNHLLFFHHDTCAECEKIHTSVKKACKALKKRQVTCIKVNITGSETYSTQAFGISGVPHFRASLNGPNHVAKQKDLDGWRSLTESKAKQLVAFIDQVLDSHALPPYEPLIFLEHQEQWEDMCGGHRDTCLGMFISK